MMLLTLLLLHSAKMLTVCDVMPELTRFDQKMVVISGIIHSTSHVVQLEGDGCRSHFKTKGYRWQDALMMAFTDSYLGQRLRGKSIEFGFISNKESVKLLDKARERVKMDIRRRRIRAVVEGMIVTGGSEYLVDNVLGLSSVDGFGHGGQTPGVLVIKEIKLVEVIDPNGKVIPEKGK